MGSLAAITYFNDERIINFQYKVHSSKFPNINTSRSDDSTDRGLWICWFNYKSDPVWFFSVVLLCEASVAFATCTHIHIFAGFFISGHFYRI